MAFSLVPVLISATASSTSHDGEIRQRVAAEVKAFEAEDLARLMAMVSNSYQSGPITKEGIRLQLLGIFQANRELGVTLKIHEIRFRGDLVFVRSSGEVAGRPLLWPYRVVIFEWQDLVDVGRREGTVWRLYGDQQ
jgi:hypothetical protein